MLGHKCLIYADDMVTITPNKFLDLTIAQQNLALDDLKIILDKVSFEAAQEKCKFVILTRRRCFNVLNINFDDNIIPYVSNIT